MTSQHAQCCHLVDLHGSQVYSKIDPECYECFETCAVINEVVVSCGKHGKHRRGILGNGDGKVFLCTSDKDIVSSGRVFRAKLHFYGEMLSEFAAIKDGIATREVEKTNRLFHNLTSLNAHSIQDLYALASQKELTASFKSQTRMLARKIADEPELAARTFLNVLKNEISIRNEFSVYRKLYDPNPAMNFSGHAIHKVILNVANLFFQVLADKEVIVDISDTDLRLSLDYESIQVALYHLMDNAAKYVEPRSTIRIYVQNETVPQVVMAMTSLYIHPTELPRLFDEGVSGELPSRLGSAGKGLGMGLVRDLLLLNGASIAVNAGPPLERRPQSGPKDTVYAENKFVISFSERSLLSKGQSVISKPVATRGFAFRHYAQR